jgi:hypothetical protein
MDAHKLRDEIFSEIYKTVLKPHGYRKKGHWIIKSARPFHWAVYLRSSRWSRRSRAQFWLDLYVYHEDFDSLMYGPREFKGPSESIAGLVTEDLGRLALQQPITLIIDENTDVQTLKGNLVKQVADVALPFFAQYGSLESILNYYAVRNIPAEAPFLAGIYLLLNLRREAVDVIEKASISSPHDNVRKWNEKALNKMLDNFRPG